MTTPAKYIQATDTLCAADPLMNAVRAELGNIERFFTQDGQWSTRTQPVVYRLYMNAATNEVVSAPLVVLTSILRASTAMLGGNMPAALDGVSNVLAHPENLPDGVGDGARTHIQTALSEGTAPDGYQRYALGVGSVALGLDADHPDAVQILESGDPRNHPAVRALWYSRALAHDNRVWDYVREQGGDPVCVTIGPDEPLMDDDDDRNPFSTALVKLLASMAEVS